MSLRTGAAVTNALREPGLRRGGDRRAARICRASSWPRRSRWPSSPCTAATARTAACRACSSRCSSPTPARACWPPRWGWRRSSPSRSSSATASPRRRTRPSTARRAALAAADSLPFPFPVVVKPSARAARSGVHICKTREQLRGRGGGRGEVRRPLLVEQFVKGREVQGAVLDDESLGAIEIVPAHEFYDYEAKYKAGSGTKYLFPAPLPPDQYARVNEVCLAGAPGARLQRRDPLRRHRHRAGRGVPAGGEHPARA